MELFESAESLIAKVLFGTLALACFASFYWSVIGVFRRPEGGFSPLYRVLQVSSAWTWAYSIYVIAVSTKFSVLNQLPALVLIAASLWIFWKTRHWIRDKDFAIVFNNESPSHLETNGPFRWVRHPFYSSYLLCYFSVFLFTLDIVMGITFLFMTSLYFKALKDEEKKFRTGDSFSEAYSSYSKTTGALFPKIFAKKS